MKEEAGAWTELDNIVYEEGKHPDLITTNIEDEKIASNLIQNIVKPLTIDPSYFTMKIMQWKRK